MKKPVNKSANRLSSPNSPFNFYNRKKKEQVVRPTPLSNDSNNWNGYTVSEPSIH